MVESDAFVSILAGVLTALFAVFLTFYLRNQWQEIQSLRAIQTELEQNTERIQALSELLVGDLQRQQVDLPIEIPPGTTIEIRYVVSFPGALSTSAFEQLKHSGMFLRLSPEIRASLFELYDTIDRINRLRQHRERIHFDDLENVHIVIDASDLDVEPGDSITEDDLSDEMKNQLTNLRRMRRSTKEINKSILRLIASISPSTVNKDIDLNRSTGNVIPRREPPSVNPTHLSNTSLAEMQSTLSTVEQQSIWSQFM